MRYRLRAIARVLFTNPMVESLTAVPCVICGKPVPIAECKTNEIGEPVHESCYAEHLKEDMKRRKGELERWRV
jgi:hypothetical protein